MDRMKGKASYYVVKEYRGTEDYEGVEHRFEKLDDATAKAETLGKMNMNAYDEAGNWHPVARGEDGRWMRRETVAEHFRRMARLAMNPPAPGSAE